VFTWAMTDFPELESEHPATIVTEGKPLHSGFERNVGYRPTRQNRSADSEKRVLESAELLFRENGYTHTKVSEIIRLSGVSTGSFYHRFGDKDGLKEVLISRFVKAAHDQISNLDVSRKTHGNLENMLGAMAGLIFDTMNHNLGIYRIVDELSKTEPEKWETFRKMGEAIRDRVCEGMHDYRTEVSGQGRECEIAAGNAVQLIIVVMLQTRLGAADMFPKEREALIRMVVDAAMGILKPER